MTPAMPITTPEAYLTGTAALSIPEEDGHVVGWHFDATFLQPGTRYRIAGQNILNTMPMLGAFGVRECAAALRSRAVQLPENVKFYAASPARAVLDLLLDTTAKHQRPDFIEVDALFEPSALPAIVERLAAIHEHLNDPTQRYLIDQWINAQQQNALTSS
jgi:hypothetical protein